tara:strand:- start:1327 stop:1956 length:630 start_codon:yes stop_codon:yes gene_type:complete
MLGHKKIAWESWNAKVDIISSVEPLQQIEEQEYEVDQMSQFPIDPGFILEQQRILYTPIGPYPEESMLKPSDRWDCWIGYTNFPVTNNISTTLNKDIEGIEALKILGKYSFFIGVAKMFDISDIRKDIEERLCIYTESEVLSDDGIQETVDLVKSQLKHNKYWSILVSTEGKVEYVVSDCMDRIYLDGLNSLIERKNEVGGIILRSEDG